VAEIILVTGGARSGKSCYAQQLGDSLAGDKLFVATCPVTDEEMRQRIERHRLDRQGAGWRTVEETVNPARALADNPEAEVVLIDCLTLWINNLLFTAAGDRFDEAAVRLKARQLAAVCGARPGVVIMVTNEVGFGIVPENALARRYRDLVGRCNQEMAGAADQVIMTICGIPLYIKEKR
jgi:adenosylcobinamide kinase/adenosylcobinamide-phosphate guanylyltransferase